MPCMGFTSRDRLVRKQIVGAYSGRHVLILGLSDGEEYTYNAYKYKGLAVLLQAGQGEWKII